MNTGFLTVFLSCAAVCSAAQTIEGVFVDSLTGKGVPSVSVFLRPGSGEGNYSSVSDAVGRFAFHTVPAGSYEIGYTSADYTPAELGPAHQIQVTDGNAIGLEVRLTARPRISGRVVDGNGDGVARARVEVLPLGSPNAMTNASGNFEVKLQQPGAYFLSVLPPADLKPPARTADEVSVWTRSFYPGVTDFESASQIAVAGHVTGIEMKLTATRAHAIRGVVLKPDGTPAARAGVTLDDGARPAWQSKPVRAEANAQGVFEFPAVVDGEWRLGAEMEAGGLKIRASEWIEMTGHALDDVKLDLAAPFTLRGRAVIESAEGARGSAGFSPVLIPDGRSPRTDIGMSNWMLWPSLYIEPALPAAVPGSKEQHDAFVEITTNQLREQGGSVGTTDANGNFTLDGLYRGSYRILSMPPAPPYYLAVVRLGETELTGADVNLSAGAPPITLVFRSDGGSLQGTAEKCAGGVLLLAPQEAALRSIGFLKTARCDDHDRFDATAVRPGGYFVIAFAGRGGVPALDERTLSQASTVTIHASENATADLRAIPRPGN